MREGNRTDGGCLLLMSSDSRSDIAANVAWQPEPFIKSQ